MNFSLRGGRCSRAVRAAHELRAKSPEEPSDLDAYRRLFCLVRTGALPWGKEGYKGAGPNCPKADLVKDSVLEPSRH